MKYFKVLKNITQQKFPSNPAPIEGRVVLFDSLLTPPQVDTIVQLETKKFIQMIVDKTYNYHLALGGSIPYIALKEVIDNTIHATFQGVIVTVFPCGNGIRVSDSGPGIQNKSKAKQLGFSTATNSLRPYIRGIGSGLPLADQLIRQIGGKLTIEDNLVSGTVVTLWGPLTTPKQENNLIPALTEGAAAVDGEQYVDSSIGGNFWQEITQRQRLILMALYKNGPLGPSRIAELINTSPSSAYRDLVVLTELGLVANSEGGKRILSSSVLTLFAEDKLDIGDR